MLAYINANKRINKIEYSGISFSEFINALRCSIDNILLLKANYIGNRSFMNFELVEGVEHVHMLGKEDIYNYGDFCFVDYESSDCLDCLTKDHIAELLFVAHLYEPLHSPFFKVLNNRFTYLAHDD